MSDDPFPRWLDPATLAWAADYCEAMSIRLESFGPALPPYIAADVCAKGLRAAATHPETRVFPCPIKPVTRTTED